MASVNNYALETVTISHDGTAGSAALFNPTISYITTTHVPVWSGAFSATTKTPSVAVGSLGAEDAKVEVNVWATSAITFTDDGVIDVYLSGLKNLSTMYQMLKDCDSANPDVSTWELSNVLSLRNAFRSCPAATMQVGTGTTNWNTGACINMSYIFSYSTIANPDVSGWDVSNVADMSGVFYGASSATPDTSNWNTGSCTNMASMFTLATLANPDVSGWDTSKVTKMEFMFYTATSAVPDTSNWNTGAVTNMESMFYGATLANPDVSGWDTSKVTKMSEMFRNATAFTGFADVAAFDVTALTTAAGMFTGTTMSTAQYDAILIAWEAQALTISAVPFGAGTATYSAGAAATARAALIADHGWVITDGGPA